MSSAESWPKLQGADSARRESPKQQRLFAEIYRVVARIPRGRVATYGQIATYLERCTPRQVGYALARADDTVDIPWHRVINHRGEVSLSGTSGESQRDKLLDEGIAFNKQGRVDFGRYGWTDE